MKKILVLTVTTLVLSLVFTGCLGKSANAPDTDSETASVSRVAESKPIESTAEDSTSSFLAGNENDTAESSESSTENSNSTATNSTAPKPNYSSEVQAPRSIPAAGTPAPRAAEKSAPRQEAATPIVTEQPKQETATPPPIETPQEAVPPTEPLPLLLRLVAMWNRQKATGKALVYHWTAPLPPVGITPPTQVPQQVISAEIWLRCSTGIRTAALRAFGCGQRTWETVNLISISAMRKQHNVHQGHIGKTSV